MSHTMAYHFPALGAQVLGRSRNASVGEGPAGPTVEEFVARVFVPEHVATKQLSGRAHYRAMLKHLIDPHNVDRIFDGGEAASRSKLKGVPGWPYVGDIPLREIQPDHVQSLIEAAIAHGYSTQTVTHIRRAASAIFNCARRTGFFAAENPAAEAVCPEVVRGRDQVLTLEQTRAALQAMRYPEKEMTLVALLTGMNLAEICGLRWRFVNMTSSPRTWDDEPIAPRSISLRNTWPHGTLLSRTPRHNTSVEITEALLPVLIALSSRERFTGPDDFVLVSSTGKPLNPRYIAVHRLKAIGESIGVPWLSWQALRRTRIHLLRQFGLEFPGLLLTPASGSPSREPVEEAASREPGSESCSSQQPGRWWLAAVVRAMGGGKAVAALEAMARWFGSWPHRQKRTLGPQALPDSASKGYYALEHAPVVTSSGLPRVPADCLSVGFRTAASMGQQARGVHEPEPGLRARGAERLRAAAASL